MKAKKIIVMLLASLLVMGNLAQTLHAVHEEDWYKDQNTTDKKSLSFHANEKQYAELQAPLSEIPQTMEMWVKLDKNMNKRQILFGNYVANKNCFSLELTQDQQLRYVEYGYEGTTLTSSIDLKTVNKTICTENWTHLAVQRDLDNQSIRLLMDGEVLLEKQFDGSGKNKILEFVPLSSNHFIGTDARKSMFLDGEIASIRLWDTYKTVTEIKTDMNLTITGNETGLAHAWILDDTTLSYAHNVVEDLKENGINATPVNFDLSGTTIYQKEGSDFTDGSACAELEQNLALAPLTFEAWVNIPKTKIGERGVMIGNYFDSYYKDIPLMNFELTANGEPRLYWNIDGKTYDYVAKGITVYTGKWIHVAIAYDVVNKQMICYINGEKANEKDFDFTPQVLNQNLKIGRDSRPTMYLKGSMADLRIWSTTRTAEEIKNAFNAEIDENTNGLLGHWKLDTKEDHMFTDTSNLLITPLMNGYPMICLQKKQMVIIASL